jgi:hypothetical protein
MEGIGELVDLVRQLQSEVIVKAEAAAMWQARAELLAMQLQQAQERILALEAPRDRPPLKMLDNAPQTPSLLTGPRSYPLPERPATPLVALLECVSATDLAQAMPCTRACCGSDEHARGSGQFHFPTGEVRAN